MTNLPQIQPHNELIQAVNARELHAFLKNKRQFSDWIKQRISEYDFVENQDFVITSQICETMTKTGKRRVTTKNEYHITLDMAKELSMVERNEQGKMARRYFIDCEKRLQASSPMSEHESKLRAIAFAISQTGLSDAAKETLLITTTETLTGTPINYRPQIEQTTHSAKEIGEKLGVSANKVGRLATAHHLKTAEFGRYVLDKSPSSVKQVETFRYFDSVIPVLQALLGQDR